MEYRDFIVGGMSGVISRTLTAPLELSKIQQQNKFMPNTTLIDVIKKEGVLGLWKGNYSNCIRIFRQMAINFGCYQYFNSFFSGVISNNQISNFLSGGLAGMIAITVVYPLENARSRLSLQTNNDHYRGLTDVIRRTPPRQLYNGLRMSLIGFTPYNALNFMFYSIFKNSIQESNVDTSVSKLLCGGLAGMAAVTFTYPTDLIRRRLQLQGFDSIVPKYDGIIDCCKKIYMKEGIPGFYRGLFQCYIKIFPAVAIQFWVMDTFKK